MSKAWVGVLLTLVVMAGCTGSATKTVNPPLTSAPPPIVTEQTGAIAGVITDEELLPLAKVGIVVAEVANLSADSDAQGKFTINDIPPGEHALIVALAGYESTTRQVTVYAGETANVSLTLKRLLIVKPHVEHLVDEGYVSLAFATPSVLSACNTQVGACTTHFEHPITAGVVAVVSTGIWDRSTPLTATRMFLRIEVEANAVAEGITPVTARLFDVSVPVNETILLDFGMTHVCTNVVSCVEDPPNRVAQVVYDQRTTLYTDVYYLQPPAQDAVAGPQDA